MGDKEKLMRAALESTLNWIREYHQQQDGTIWDEGLAALDKDIREALKSEQRTHCGPEVKRGRNGK